MVCVWCGCLCSGLRVGSEQVRLAMHSCDGLTSSNSHDSDSQQQLCLQDVEHVWIVCGLLSYCAAVGWRP